MFNSLFAKNETYTQNFYKCQKCDRVYDGNVLQIRNQTCECGNKSFSSTTRPIKVQPELRSTRKPNSVTHSDVNRFDSYEDGPQIKHTRIPSSHKTQMVLSVIIIAVVAITLIAILSLFNNTKTTGIVQDPVVVMEQAPVVVIETQDIVVAEPIIVSSENIVDVKSVSSFGPVQYVMIGFLIIIILCGYLDRRQSNQAHDAWIGIFGGLVVVWVGSWAFVRAFFTAIELVNPSLIIFLVSLAVVLTTSLTGKADLSPIGLFFGIIAIFGGVLLADLGSLQDVFRIPSASLLTLPTMFQLIEAKQWELVRFSMVVYGCLTIAILAYGFEILRSSETKETNMGGILISLVGVGIFVGLRMFAKDIPVLNTVGGAFMIVVIYNFVIATVMRERLSGTGINWAEYKLGLVKIVSPWDIFAFQAIIGAFLVMASGKI